MRKVRHTSSSREGYGSNSSLVASNVVSCSWIKLERNLLSCLCKTHHHYISDIVLFEKNI